MNLEVYKIPSFISESIPTNTLTVSTTFYRILPRAAPGTGINLDMLEPEILIQKPTLPYPEPGKPGQIPDYTRIRFLSDSVLTFVDHIMFQFLKMPSLCTSK